MNKINMESISNEFYMNRNFNVFKRLQTVTAEQASCLIVASKQIAAAILQMFPRSIKYIGRRCHWTFVILRAAHFRQNKHRPPSLIGQLPLAYLCWKISQADNQNIGTSRVLPAGVLRNMGKSGDVCNVIFRRPGVISWRKNAQNVH